MDQQGSRLPNDFILEEELCWLAGMVGKVRFQREERMEPGAVTGENGRSVAEYGEGRCLPVRHGSILRMITHCEQRWREVTDMCRVY